MRVVRERPCWVDLELDLDHLSRSLQLEGVAFVLCLLA